MYWVVLVCLCFSSVLAALPKHCELDHDAFDFESIPITISCASQSLEEQTNKKPVKLTRYNSVTLVGCPPTEKSYAVVLKSLNILVGENFVLSKLPAGTNLGPAALECLYETVTHLAVSAETDVITLRSDLLDAFPGLKSLELVRARLQKVPVKLEKLLLKETGMATLPEGASNVAELKVYEKKLPALPSSLPQLQKLYIAYANWPLPQAPALTQLWISGAGDQLKARYFERFRDLNRLEIRGLEGKDLPKDLLAGAEELTVFSAVSNNLTRVPGDLFAHNKYLSTIDLSNNNLVSFPSELFVELHHLETLRAEHNQLSAGALGALAPAISLHSLMLAGNPLGDLCPPDDTSVIAMLEELRILSLPGTGLTRACDDWLLDRLRLSDLDLGHNAITSLSCAQLRMQREPRSPGRPRPEVNLLDNPLTEIHCDKEDWVHAFNEGLDSEPEVIVKLRIGSSLKCSCGSYWLARVLGERGAMVDYSPIYEKDCTADWAPCSA